MTGLRSILRRFGASIAACSALLLVGTLFVAAMHVHAGGASHTSCAICTSAHAPSTADATSPHVAPAPRNPIALDLPRSIAPHCVDRRLASSRAPPSA